MPDSARQRARLANALAAPEKHRETGDKQKSIGGPGIGMHVRPAIAKVIVCRSYFASSGVVHERYPVDSCERRARAQSW